MSNMVRFRQARPTVKRIKCEVFQYTEADENGQPRTRYFRFDLNALADFEQEVGMGFGQLMQMKASFAMVRALYFCGLKHEDRSLSIERIGHMLQAVITDDEHPLSLDDLMTTAFSALSEQGALGKPKKADEQEEDITDVPKNEAGENAPSKNVTPVTTVGGPTGTRMVTGTVVPTTTTSAGSDG